MKLYSITGYGRYGGGMAIVAASSPARAQELAGAAPLDPMWGTSYTDAHATVKELEVKLGRGETEGIKAHFATGE